MQNNAIHIKLLKLGNLVQFSPVNKEINNFIIKQKQKILKYNSNTTGKNTADSKIKHK